MNSWLTLPYLIKRTIYINNTGRFFDMLIKKIPNENLVTIDKLNYDTNEFQIIKYPNYDELIKNIDKLKSMKNICFFLYKTQKKEIEFLSMYFNLVDYIDVIVPERLILEFMCLDNYTIEDIKKLYEEKYLFRFVYIFLRLKPILNLNPSNCFEINEKNYETIFSKKDFENLNEINFPNTYEYLKKSRGHFCARILIDLVYFDLDGYRNERIDYILKLIKFENYQDIDKKELNVSEEVLKKYKNGNETIAWEKANGKIMFIGAY